MPAPIDWLLQGEPYIAYRTRVDLLGLPESDAQVVADRRKMLADPALGAILAGLAGWPGVVISSHKSAGQPFHKLNFIADLGLRAGDPAMDIIIPRILAHQSAQGPFQLTTNVPTHFGGTGEDSWAWALCDAPLIVYALECFGLGDHPAVQAALSYLVGLLRVRSERASNGWPCAVSPELGSFRGPGRKEDPCPYANLAMLKALAVSNAWRDSPASHVGAETLLGLWADSLTRHPYIFYMGTDFRKLKAPLVWYDLLHVLDVLSRFPWLKEDPRLVNMVELLEDKADAQGRFTPESVWAAWKGWEFAQKKVPSRWVTLLAWRIMGRIEGM
jgi:hypothetical protein